MDRYQITFQSWNKVASAYQDIFMDLAIYNDTYDTFCQLIGKPNAHIFEIGCGPGNITKYLLTKRPDFKIEAIDIAPNMIELARKNNPEASFKVMDCREIDTITENFDGIICGFCLPYLSETDCAKLIKDCSNLLNPNGIFYFSTIEGDYSSSGFETGSSGDSMYVYYHPEAILKENLNTNGFKLTDLQRKIYSKKDGSTLTNLIFIAQKK